MMKTVTLTIIAFCCYTKSGNCQMQKSQNINELKAIGYWQIPKAQRIIKEPNSITGPGNYLFYYDGNFVTIYLFTEKDWMWKTEDDFYKLKSKWNGDSLYYLPPFGDWVYLAKFNETNFFCENKLENLTWKYQKITKREIEKRDYSILKNRNVHNYEIKPTDKMTCQ